MERPPQPPKPTFMEKAILESKQKQIEEKQAIIRMGTEALTKARIESTASLQGLPSGLQGIILSFTASSHSYSDIKQLAQNIAHLAQTDRALYATLNDPNTIIAILNALPYTINALTLIEFLQNKPGSLPVMKNPKIHAWIADAKKKLVFGKELTEATNANNANDVAALIKNPNINLNWVNEAGNTALMRAAFKNNKEIAALLIAVGANPNGHNRNGNSALALTQNTEIAESLLNVGANPNAKNDTGGTALMMAAQTGLIEIAKLLVSYGANLDAQTDNGTTALMLAAHQGQREMAEFLLNKCADPMIRARNKASAADLALANSHNDLALIIGKAYLKKQAGQVCSVQ
jgi:ankyrin repeat protein